MQYHHLDAVAAGVVTYTKHTTMAAQSPPLTDAQPPREKLLVIRFLNAHLAQGGIPQHLYDMLYRVALIISAMGREIRGIVQSKITYVRSLQNLEW